MVFLGDSITENGTYIRDLEAFFLKYMLEYRLEWINLGVSGETAAGTSEADHPYPRPCVHERLERALAEARPDCLFIAYGMNDGIYHPLTKERFCAYQEGVRKVVEQSRAAGTRVILMTPTPFDVLSAIGTPRPKGMDNYSFDLPYEGYDLVLTQYGEWLQTFGRTEGLTVVDVHQPLNEFIRSKREQDASYRYGDGVHPEEDGHWVIARTILSKVFHLQLERVPTWATQGAGKFISLMNQRRSALNAAWREHVGHTNPYKFETPPLAEVLQHTIQALPEVERAARLEGGPEEASSSLWHGFSRIDWYWEGRECTLVAPHEAAPGKPWVWRTEFFGGFADADIELVKQGWHVAYCRLSDLYGCPYAVRQMEAFRAGLTDQWRLSSKPVLFGFSRGGLYALQYVAAYPERVSAVYLDAPVVDICSWPGGSGTGTGAPAEWRECLEVYGIIGPEVGEQDLRQPDILQRAGEVTERLLTLLAAPAQAGVPILIVSGDADRAVPFAENGAILQHVYSSLGGKVSTILKPGGDHHPHSLPDVGPIVEFVLQEKI